MSTERLLQFLDSRRAGTRAPFPPSYLSFLNLVDVEESQRQAAELLQTCRALGDRLDEMLEVWLSESNWRPHLVGVVALVLSGATPARVAMLWRAIDRYSWVAPQLVAAAALLDPEFATGARQRIEACQQTPLPAASAKESWTSMAVEPKRLAALVALSGRSGEPPWLQACLAHPSVAVRLGQDIDRGGEVALRWLRQLQDVAAAVTREPG